MDSTSPNYMPSLNHWLGQRGTRFVNHLAPTSVCCPARTSIFTGQHSHTHNVTSNGAPNGKCLPCIAVLNDRGAHAASPSALVECRKFARRH